MKNKIKILLFFLCLSIGISEVNAFDKTDEFVLIGGHYISSTNVTDIHYSGIKFNNTIYSVENKNNYGEKYYAYCADPNINAKYALKVDHILMNGNKNQRADDYGLLTILQNGKWEYDGSVQPDGSANETQYEATSMAVRMYVNAVLNLNYYHTTKPIFGAYIKTAYDWIKSDSQMLEDYKKLTGNDDVKTILSQYGYGEDKAPFVYTGIQGKEVERQAKELLKKGLNAAANFNDDNIASVEVQTAGGTAKEVDDSNSDKTIYKQLVIASIKVSNFSDKGEVYYKGIDAVSDYTNVNPIGFSMTYSNKIEDYQNHNNEISRIEDTELLEFLKRESSEDRYEDDEGNAALYDTIYIAYEVVMELPNDAAVDNPKACTAAFRINYEYSDTTLLNGAMLFGSSDAGKDVTYNQRFLIYSAEPISESYDVNLKMCNSSCSPEIGLPQICPDVPEEENIDEENELVWYEYREGYNESVKKYAIEKCILKNTDSASNSLKLNDAENAANISSNNYCSIYCKEDYKFGVPYPAPETKNGRYFDIGMSIKGQMDCYSTQIDRESFASDVLKSTVDMVNAYNKWQKYKELKQAYDDLKDGISGVLTDDTIEEDSELFCYKTKCRTNCFPDSANCSCVSNGSSLTEKDYKAYYDFTGSYYIISEDGTVTTGDEPNVYKYDEETGKVTEEAYEDILYGSKKNVSSGYCSGTGGSCSCVGYKCEINTPEEEFIAEIEALEVSLDEEIETAASEITKASQNIINYIDQFNSCMGDDTYKSYESDNTVVKTWEMSYKFNPKIYYSYDEPEPGVDTQKWIEEAKSFGGNLLLSKDLLIEAEYCNPSNENCEGDKTEVKSIFGEIMVPTTVYCKEGLLDKASYDCASSGLKVNFDSKEGYEKKNLLLCTASADDISCSNKEFYITSLDYIHKTAVASGSFVTPPVFYTQTPTGAVVVTDNPLSYDNLSLVPGLPVGVNTNGGTYFYILTITDLGQYFNKQELGRIFGTGNSVSQAERLDITETINGDELTANDYACIYKVNTNDALDGNWCVKGSQGYYVCEGTEINENCTSYGEDREGAISAAGGEDHNYNCCPNCVVRCVGTCIVDINMRYHPKVSFVFKPINPSIIYPNDDREPGYNWDMTANSEDPLSVLVAQKAGNTISQIKDRAEIDNIESPSAEDMAQLKEVEDYKFSVKLTPEMATWIKRYNSENKNNGNYNNNSLVCYDTPVLQHTTEETCEKAGYIWDEKESGHKCKIQKATCFSTFIDDLMTEGFSDNIVSKYRDNARENAAYNQQVLVSYTSSEYDKLENKHSADIYKINDYWTIYQFTHIDVNGDKIPDIGPSWK